MIDWKARRRVAWIGCVLAGMAALPEARAEYSAEVRDLPDGGTEIRLANEFLTLAVLPDSSGRISSFRVEPVDVELIPPLREEVVQEPLLPEIVKSNRIGYSDWLWGVHVGPRRPYRYELLSETSQRVGLVLHGRAGGLAVERRLELAPRSLIVRQTITLTNTDTAPVTVDYWAHLSLDGTHFFGPGERQSVTYLPAEVGGLRRKGRMLTAFDQPGVQRWSQRIGQAFFQPFFELGGSWMVRASQTSPVAIAMRMASDDLQPDGVLYLWEGPAAQGDLLATLEILAGQRRLQPGESATYHVDLIGLWDIEPFVTLTASHAVSLGPADTWRVLTLEDAPPQTVTIQHQGQWHELTLPALQGGQRLDLPQRSKE